MFDMSPYLESMYKLDYRDFESILCEVLDIDEFCFVSTQEARNDNTYSFVADGDIFEDDRDTLDCVREGKFEPYATQALLNVAVKDGLLPSGNYVVNVYW
jgi:hypothetical protein